MSFGFLKEALDFSTNFEVIEVSMSLYLKWKFQPYGYAKQNRNFLKCAVAILRVGVKM